MKIIIELADGIRLDEKIIKDVQDDILKRLDPLIEEIKRSGGEITIKFNDDSNFELSIKTTDSDLEKKIDYLLNK